VPTAFRTSENMRPVADGLYEREFLRTERDGESWGAWARMRDVGSPLNASTGDFEFAYDALGRPLAYIHETETTRIASASCGKVDPHFRVERCADQGPKHRIGPKSGSHFWVRCYSTRSCRWKSF
jgi:hypothetical protein